MKQFVMGVDVLEVRSSKIAANPPRNSTKRDQHDSRPHFAAMMKDAIDAKKLP